MSIKTVMITGANGGLGKETARQFALIGSTETVYLACRNREKAEDAKKSLEEITGRSLFEVVEMDTSDVNSVRSAVDTIDRPIEGLVMNAGGIVGKNFAEKTADGVTQMLAVNLLGHTVLLERLLKSDKLTKAALFSGSEAARGVPKFGLRKPRLNSYSVDELESVCNGTFFPGKMNFMIAYQYVKFLGALYMSSMARRYPELRLMTVSPGSTSGTDIYNNAPLSTKVAIKIASFLPLKSLREGSFHSVEDGARRYVDALNDEAYKSGIFYASEKLSLTGAMVDQGDVFPDLNNELYQDNAYEALHRFVK